MSIDYQDQVRFGYTEPDEDDSLPSCPGCGYEFTHEPTAAVEIADDHWQLTWTCPVCQKDYSAAEVYA